MEFKDIPPAKPYFPQEDIRLIMSDVTKILHSGMLTLGDYTKRLETEFAKLCNVKRAIAVNSGTSALEIVLRAVGLKKDEEVLVPTNTFSATAAAVIFAGGKPVLTDIDAKTLCINAANVSAHLTSKTRAVIPVHIGGLICPEIKAIREICEDHNCFLIEDAAHAQGSKKDDRTAGTFGDAGCFSLYPTKVITAGEGGVITTNEEDLARKALILRDQGKENFSSNIIVELGYNWRMSEINAAIGLSQLERLAEFIEYRSMIAKYYDEKLSRISNIETLKIPRNITSNYYKYVTFLSSEINRDEFKQRLREKGVRCSGEVYWPPLHMQPIYKSLLHVKEGDFPQSEDICRRLVCLPMYSQMTLDEAEYVVNRIEEVLSEF